MDSLCEPMEAAEALTGFLFGNIDEKGHLVEDVLDEESKRHLAGLNSLGGFSNLVEELSNEESITDDNEESSGEVKLPTAVDYFDIVEVIDEDDTSSSATGFVPTDSKGTSEGDMVVDDARAAELMPPPSWVTRPHQPHRGNSDECSAPSDIDKKYYAPLADMLPAECRGVDVRDIFPEFRPGEVLRFSRLFKPQHVPSFYKKKKRRKGEDDDTKDDMPAPGAGTHKLLELDWGRPPAPEDILPDEEFLMKMPPKGRRADQSSTAEENVDGTVEDSSCRDLSGNANVPSAEWRYGPAQYWYDMYNVPETGDCYDLGFKLKERSSSEEGKEYQNETNATVAGNRSATQSPAERLPAVPDEAYLMVSQTHWENDVIWNGDEVKQSVVAQQWHAAAAAGWLPNNAIRTVLQFQQACRSAVANGASKGSVLAGSLAHPGVSISSRVAFKHPDDSEDGYNTSGLSANGGGMEFYSLFPIDSTDLIYGVWENQVIWDPEAMDDLPKPAVLTLDPNDDNIILEMPEDKEPSANSRSDSSEAAGKMEKEKRRSRLFMEKAGLIKEKEEEEEEPDASLKKDPFNLSNDEHYNPRLATDHALRTNLGGNLIQHSTPAVDLCQPFFPTHLGAMKLRTFHRPPLKRYSHGPMAQSGPKAVLSLNKQIKRKAKIRNQERLAAGGGDGDIFLMRTCADLTACDGDVILAEYSEEYPPLMMQVGMATKIKNYYRRKPGSDNKPPQFKYGELAYAHHSPFLGMLHLGQSVPAFENNMFRAPIYMHDMPHTDFLVIRTRQSFHIRKVTDIFCVGQECPLMEVPGPNSKRANVFVRDFLQGFIYRLFWKSTDTPRRIKMEDIKKAFPSHSESSIRKRLKLCADFKRTGMDSNWWVIKSEFRLPSEDEIRAMVLPEQCCAYYSMLAAEQRLKDAGYGEKSLFAPEADEEDEQKIDDEVKTAPWNTTRAYISAMKGKCLLSLRGDADPTGCGEGFAYVRVPNKPQVKGATTAAATSGSAADEAARRDEKRTVTGTDADLRRLNLKDAKNLLREFGVPESEIKKLSRWEVIDVVRTMSTQQAKMGDEAAMTKFARGNRFSIAEHQERYKEECQRIFDLQNRILSNPEQISTEEESDDSGEDSDFEEMGKNIESMLSNKKTSMQLTKEREEAERKELHKMLMGNSSNDDKSRDKRKGDKKGRKDDDHTDDEMSEGSNNRKLTITRTFKNEMGHEYTRTETVSKAPVIEAYLRIRNTKDPAFIQQFASIDEQAKEEMKRERRRIQEQLRRIKRNQEKQKNEPSDLSSKKKKNNNAKQISLKCGACGAVGHMRTNKECPLYSATSMALAAGGSAGAGVRQQSGDGGSLSVSTPGAGGGLGALTVAPSVEEEERLEQKLLPHDDNLIRVEGTKVKFTKQLVEHAEKVKRETLRLKFPRHLPAGAGQVSAASSAGVGTEGVGAGRARRRRAGATLHCDYLSKPTKSAHHRRRADPHVSLSSVFESIINDMKDLPNTLPFHVPVNAREVADYYSLIKNPMDLQTLKQNVRDRKYGSREEFLTDVSRIVENSKLYNGPKSVYTLTAQSMLDLCLKRFAEKEEKLMRLEKAINPLLDDNDQVALSYILDQIVKTLKAIDNSWPFHQPVNRKQLKDYYQIITSPMDLQTLETNVSRHLYHNHNEFLADVELIEKNSIAYNGPDSPFSHTAHNIVEACKRALAENESQLMYLEQGIQQTQEAAMDGIESESAISGGGGGTSIGDDMEDEYSNAEEDGIQRRRAQQQRLARMRKSLHADDEDDEYAGAAAAEGSAADRGYYGRRRQGSVDGDEDEEYVDVGDYSYPENDGAAVGGAQEEEDMESMQQYEAEAGSSPGGQQAEDEAEEAELLVADLHVTPENSGDEGDEEAESSQPAALLQQEYGDANSSYQDEDSFDPNEFFRNAHFSAGSGEQPEAAATDQASTGIGDDLQVSESSDEGGVDNDDENQGFSLDDFFQK